jgi:PAS domain S-box-containing protein
VANVEPGGDLLESVLDEGGLRGRSIRWEVSQEFLDALGMAVYATDADGILTSFNEAAVEFWGRRPVAGIDSWSSMARLYHPDGRPIPPEESPMGVTLREHRVVRGVEMIAERADGKRRWFLPHPSPLYSAEGTVIGAVNVLFDITERKDAEEAASYLAAIISSSDDAIVSKDLDGVVTSWNEAAERLFGFTAEEMIGRSIRTIIPADRQEEEDEVLTRVGSGQRVDHFETVRQRKDGSLVPISLTISPVKDKNGVIIGASKIARDITERREADAKIAEALAVKDEFVSLVSHEIRTPLTTILGNASVLARGGGDEEMRQAATLDIHQEALRLNSLIDDMMSLARLERETLELEPVALGRVVEQVVHRHASKSDRRIKTHIDKNAPVVMGEEALVGHVLSNYLLNAEKYSPRETTIEVHVDGEGRVRVLDRGIGIDASEAQQLFESFYRSSNVGHVGGMGVGLSVCRRLIHAVGGSVWASPRDGGGSEFGFRLLPYDDGSGA